MMRVRKLNILFAIVALHGGIAHATAPVTQSAQYMNTSNASQSLQEGWNQWSVRAVPDAPAWCCFEWQNGKARPTPCDLDRPTQGMGSSEKLAQSDNMRIYARVKGGAIVDLRSYSSSCPVRTNQAMAPLKLTERQSLALLDPLLTNESNLGENAMAAVAVHNDQTAMERLRKLAESGPSLELRKRALFWLGQLHGAAGVAVIQAVLRTAQSSELREHAVFVLSQSKDRQVVDTLLRVARSDLASNVRSAAWFWLAQIQAPDLEAHVTKALTHEASDEVQEKMIFALNELPQERAARALVHLLEERALAKSLRKHALFWLAQNKSTYAHSYFDRVFK